MLMWQKMKQRALVSLLYFGKVLVLVSAERGSRNKRKITEQEKKLLCRTILVEICHLLLLGICIIQMQNEIHQDLYVEYKENSSGVIRLGGGVVNASPC